MRTTRIWIPATLLVAASLAGNGCILLPEIKDRIVQLAASGSTSADFDATGPETATLNIPKVVSVGSGTDLDLRQILDDAGVDVSTVADVKVSGVAYAITAADPTAGRTVQGNLTVEGLPLITGFVTNVDAVTGFQTATLQTDGVNKLNDVLNQLLTELKAGLSPTKSVTFSLTGTTTPNSTPTRDINFQYAVKLTVSMVGTVTVSVPD